MQIITHITFILQHALLSHITALGANADDVKYKELLKWKKNTFVTEAIHATSKMKVFFMCLLFLCL
jgi:hypothetical protein